MDNRNDHGANNSKPLTGRPSHSHQSSRMEMVNVRISPPAPEICMNASASYCESSPLAKAMTVMMR
jgi:hypothetical protein